MKKVIVMDLDGTLLTEDKRITKINKDAIADAIAQGWDIVLSTGKSVHNGEKYYDELKLNTWFITSQGQMIENRSKSKVITNFMEQEDIRNLFSKKEPYGAVIETIDGVYSTHPDDDRIVKFLNCTPQLYKGQNLEGIIGLYVMADKKTFYESPKFDIFKWDTGEGYKVLSFKPKGINKDFALKKVIELEEYKKIVVFGNGRNDLKSLQEADLGIAMINSQKRVLENVENKTEFDNENSGVGIEIRKILNGFYNI